MTSEHETRKSLQLGLFEKGQADVDLSPARRQQLAALIEALMIEIAAALASREDTDEQNHR